jgi:hypothetical protein
MLFIVSSSDLGTMRATKPFPWRAMPAHPLPCMQVFVLYKASDNYDPKKEALLERQALAQQTGDALASALDPAHASHAAAPMRPGLSRVFQSFRHPGAGSLSAAAAAAAAHAHHEQQAVVVDGRVQLGPGATLPPTTSWPAAVRKAQPATYAAPLYSGACMQMGSTCMASSRARRLQRGIT